MLAALVATAVLLSGDELFAEPAFDRKVSFRERLLPVSDLCQTLGKQLDVKLRPVRAVADLKLALLVRERTAKWTLERVADVLDLGWKKTADGYELQASAEAAQTLMDARRKRETAERSAQRKWLESVAALAAKPYGQLVQEHEALAAEREKLQKERPPGWSDRLATTSARFQALQTGVQEPAYALGSLVRANSSALSTLLTDGSILAGSTERLAGVLPFTPSFAQVLSKEGRSLWLIAGRLRGEIVYCYIRRDGQGASALGGQFRIAPDTDGAVPARFAGWGESLDVLAAKLLDRRLREVSSEGWPEHPIHIDVILNAAERSDLDLVADAFRLPAPLNIPPGGTVAELWKSMAGHVGGPYLRSVDGALLYRHARFWEWRDSEIPERTLAALNSVQAQNRLALFDASADFAMGLSTEQTRRFAIRYEGFGANVEAARYALPALRFWAQLPPDLRRRALDRVPLRRAEMPLNAQAAYFRSVCEHLLLGGSDHPETDVRLLLSAAGAEGDSPAFLAETSRVPYTLVQATRRAYPIPLAQAPEGSVQDGFLVRHVFSFGFSAADAMTFGMSLLEPRKKN